MRGGLGGAEFLAIIGVVLVLFGPSILTFWLGYMTGRSRSKDEVAEKPVPVSPSTASSARSTYAVEESRAATQPAAATASRAADPVCAAAAPELAPEPEPQPGPKSVPAAKQLWVESVLSTEYIEPEEAPIPEPAPAAPAEPLAAPAVTLEPEPPLFDTLEEDAADE